MFKPYAVLWAIGLLVAAAWFMQPGADVRAAEDDVAVEMDVDAVAAEQPLTVVTYSDGRTGFFDQTTRTIYIYDRALRRCDTIRQIKTLGESLERVRN
jgi:hypothetical protein